VYLPSSVRPVSVGIVRVGWRYFGLVGGPEPSVYDPEKYKKLSYRSKNGPAFEYQKRKILTWAATPACCIHQSCICDLKETKLRN
jgi:hypothetical protein